MVIFLNADGSAQKVTPQHVYQGSNNVNDITVIAPFAPQTAMQIGFILPNGLYWESSDGSRYVPMERRPQSINDDVTAWHFNLTASLTERMGELYVAINAVTAQGNTTSYMCKMLIEESVLPNLPDTPDPGVYDLLQLYIAQLDERTQNVPNLVAGIQKVAGNAFTYTNNSGVESAPIVLSGGADAPIPVNTASKIAIPETAWQPQYVGTDIANYTCTITAAQHGQMRDDATPSDLWVSADTADGTDLLGYFPRYAVDTSGNITITVNQPVVMNVRVWNGKSIVDTTARELISTETDEREAADQKLQDQINELVSGNKDEVARQAIKTETEDRKAADQALQTNINAVDTRAMTAETELQENINTVANELNALVQAVSFTASAWSTTPTAQYYLGAVSKTVTVPTGKRIIQVLDGNNSPRGTWQNNVIYANEAFAGVAIII